MLHDPPKLPASRDQTDQSLRGEREQVDGALAETQAASEADTDLAVLRTREKSDAALVAARDKADVQMEGARAVRDAAVSKLALERQLEDRLVLRARERADALRKLARDTADELMQSAASSSSSTSIAAERDLEDSRRCHERASADQNLRRERDENARVLSRLLPLEREKTDRYLLTERRRSDAAISSRDTFLAMVSHDLRSLLGGIVLCADVIAADAEQSSGSVAAADAANIQRYAARMNRLIGDLIDVVSIDAGKFAIVPAACDATELVAEVVNSYEAAAAERGVSLWRNLGQGRLLADFDRERMLQVLANLVSNALKFTPRGGRIDVYVEHAEGQLHGRVSDSGSGVPPEAIETMFERFWQQGKDDRRGLGLGLYISRCIVEAHGGRIWADSKVGEGCTIHFTFGIPARAG